MNNKLIVIVILAVIIGLIIWKAGESSQASAYCSPDGILTDKQPIQSHRSFCIKSSAEDTTFAANTQSNYTFSIVTDEGKTVKNFISTHTKLVHIIVVRKDLAEFQHVHPDFDEVTGEFALNNLIFPSDGEYRIFADFQPSWEKHEPEALPVTISEDVKVGTNYDPVPLGTEEKTKTFGDYEISLAFDKSLESERETMLIFNLKRNGKAVTGLEPYLGADGHSVVLTENTLEFIHLHGLGPVEFENGYWRHILQPNGTLAFRVTFPGEGKYKIFTQFQHQGIVITSDFVVSVAAGANETAAPDHSMH